MVLSGVISMVSGGVISMVSGGVVSMVCPYLHDAVADGAVGLPAHQQQADHHHHGDGHGHHQQPHHGAAVKRLQGIRLLREQERVNNQVSSSPHARGWCAFDLGGI